METVTRDSPAAVRAPLIIERLRRALPDARIALEFADRWQLLVATILSAQATDKKVNEVTPALFARYPTPEAMAAARPEDVEPLISSIGLYRSKARYLVGAARMIVERFGGEVPGTMEELLQLPGVARKTANVVLSNGFGRNEGVVVDTHVRRIARRLGLTRHDDPVRIERRLMRLFPREQWLEVADLFIHHGRRTCLARAPRCDECVIEDLCPSSRVAGRRDRARADTSRPTRRRPRRGRTPQGS